MTTEDHYLRGLEKTWGPDSDSAVLYLKGRGFELDDQFSWNLPPEHEPTEKEREAMDFLIYFHDFGGLLR